jgi:hypothetical protein
VSCLRLAHGSRRLLSSSRRRSLVGEVEELEAALRAHRGNIPSSPDEAFRPAFIEQMVYCWVRLTAKHPTRGTEAFKAFVAAAHATLFVTSPADLGLPFFVEPWEGGEEKARAKEWRAALKKKGPRVVSKHDEWEWQIQKTLERINKRPKYDGGYRYEEDLVPPIVGVQPSLARRRPTITRGEFDEETKRLIQEMLGDGEGSRAAAQILWCEFELAGRELKNRYLGEAKHGGYAVQPCTGRVVGREPGYAIWAAYSPMENWTDIWQRGQDARGDPAMLKVFTQQDLGEPYEPRNDTPDWEKLLGARKPWKRGVVPWPTSVLTGFIDVQGNRFEWGLWAWGEGFQGWLVDHPRAVDVLARGGLKRRNTSPSSNRTCATVNPWPIR